MRSACYLVQPLLPPRVWTMNLCCVLLFRKWSDITTFPEWYYGYNHFPEVYLEALEGSVLSSVASAIKHHGREIMVKPFLWPELKDCMLAAVIWMAAYSAQSAEAGLDSENGMYQIDVYIYIWACWLAYLYSKYRETEKPRTRLISSWNIPIPPKSCKVPISLPWL